MARFIFFSEICGHTHLCLLITLTVVLLLKTSRASLTTSPNTSNGVLTVCPGDPIAITCDYVLGSSGNSRWRVTGGGAGVNCDNDVSHINQMDRPCGVFTLTMISGTGGPTLNSTATATASSELDGVLVECVSGDLSETVFGNVTISVLEIPTPSIESVWQISQSSIRVNMSVLDTQCVGSYVATATQQTGTDFSQGTSTSSTVEITGLDICSYDYDVVGNVVTPNDNIEGPMSAAYPFVANLSGLTGVMNVRNTADRTSLMWDLGINPGFETCFFQYTVSWGDGGLNVSTTLATREQLAVENFPFCQPVNVTVTPLIRRGPLPNVESTSQVSLIIPGFSEPMIIMVEETGFTQNNTNDSIVFANTVQSISDTIVVNRTYGVSLTGMTCTPDMSFTGDSFMASLPSNAHGQTYTVCVSFQNGDCMSMSSIMMKVPVAEIALRADPAVTDTTFVTIIDLPVTFYTPGELLLLISLVSSNDADRMFNESFTADYQYTLSQTGLMPETAYNYTVDVVLRNNTNQIVTSLMPGSFVTSMNNGSATPTTMAPTTMPTTPEATTPPEPTGGCGTTCVIAIVVVIVLVVIIAVLVLIAAVLIYLYCKKKTGTMKVTSHELQAPLGTSHDEEAPASPMDKEQTTATFTNPDSVRNPSPPAEGAEEGAKVDAAVIYADLDITAKNKAQKTATDKPKPDDPEIQYSTITFAKDEAPTTTEPPKEEPKKEEEPATEEPGAGQS